MTRLVLNLHTAYSDVGGTIAKNSPERVMMKKTSMKMRAPVSTSVKLKSKLEEDS